MGVRSRTSHIILSSWLAADGVVSVAAGTGSFSISQHHTTWMSLSSTTDPMTVIWTSAKKPKSMSISRASGAPVRHCRCNQQVNFLLLWFHLGASGILVNKKLQIQKKNKQHLTHRQAKCEVPHKVVHRNLSFPPLGSLEFNPAT